LRRVLDSQLAGDANRQPIPSQQLTCWSARPDTRQYLILFFGQHLALLDGSPLLGMDKIINELEVGAQGFILKNCLNINNLDNV
jgi:hypothetical protein